MSADEQNPLDYNTAEDMHDSNVNNEAEGGLDDLFDGDASDTESTNGGVPHTIGIAAMPKIPKRGRLSGTGQEGQSFVAMNKTDQDEEGDEEAGDDGEQQQPLDPKQAEIDEINRKIDAALKSGRNRRRKRTDEDDAAIDELIVDLRKRMRDAAYHDIDDNKDRLPAIHKLSMLPEVVEELGKVQLYEALLDNNIVDSIRLWLEPLDDGSLPNLDVQNAMLECLKKLPIRRDHLRESGIGKIILFMSRCPRISERNRRICEQFVQQWSRMVLRLSSDYHDRRVKEAAVNLDHRRHNARRLVASSETS
ncbi:Transcription factor iws1, partial [Coemansia erecta]